jgi:hypothetical protein
MASNRWQPISNSTIEQLVVRSEVRVKDNEDFVKIRESLAKRAEAGDEVLLADLIEDRQEESHTESEKESEKKLEKESNIGKLSVDEPEEELSLQAEEALNVLADLVKAQKKNLQSSL